MEQRSDEWYAAKLGKVGCSRLDDVLAEGKSGGPSVTRKNYMMELLCERLTGNRTALWTNQDMQWGIDNEPLARSVYEAEIGFMVTDDGGRECPDIPGLWDSPDGLISEDGGIEIKCPNTATHLETLTKGTIKRGYILQMAGGIICYKRKWWDFVSFDPRLPPNLRFYRKRFMAEDLPIEMVRTGVIAFLRELDELEKTLRDRSVA